MAIFYPRKQTVIIFVVCLLAVWGVAYYASGNASATRKTTDHVLDVGDVSTNIETSPISNSDDWQKQFIDNTAKNSAAPSSKKTGSAEKTTPQTMTDKLGQQLFASYMQLSQANLLNNKDVVSQTAGDLVESQINTNPTKTYTLSDLPILSTMDKSILNNFSISVGQIMESYPIKKSESAIMQSYLTDNDAKVLKSIDPIIKAYKKRSPHSY